MYHGERGDPQGGQDSDQTGHAAGDMTRIASAGCQRAPISRFCPQKSAISGEVNHRLPIQPARVHIPLPKLFKVGRMRITKIETFLANTGLRNYLFLRLHTDRGLTGIGESTLEWQEQTVEALIHEFFADRYLMGANPCDIEDLVSEWSATSTRAARR